MMPRMLATLPWWLTAALVLMPGCAVEYTVPLDTDGNTTTQDRNPATIDDDDDDDDDSDSDGCDAPDILCDEGCVNPGSHTDHCGGCGRGCSAMDTCVQGECIDACDNGCELITEVCAAGTCECRPGFARCGGACVDIDIDAAHCGECGEVCAENEDGEIELYLCEAGECHDDELGCGAGLTECGQSCVDLDSHPLHCNACNRACDGDQGCIDGDCVDP